MIKTYSILSEKFLNAVSTAYTLHAENRRQQSPWHTVSEIDAQSYARD